ncbi:hypothetical protein Tco_0930263 [Tanacetum coccineum]
MKSKPKKQKQQTQLESELTQSSSRNTELESELKSVLEKSTDHEEQANSSHQRSIELEDIIQSLSSKTENNRKKASELELLLKVERYIIQELEEQITTLEKKLTTLENALETVYKNKKELSESLDLATIEKKQPEYISRKTSKQLVEAENLVEVLRNELQVCQQKIEAIESNLVASGFKESEVEEY